MKKMEITIQKSHYNMGKYLSIIFFIFLSCEKQQNPTSWKKNEDKKNNIVIIKDTVLFVNSSEGENVALSVNRYSQDSIIVSEVLGETGKSEYRFVFNKKLIKGHCVSYQYYEPLSINPNPVIKSVNKENLYSSHQSQKRLSAIFDSYNKLILKNKR